MERVSWLAEVWVSIWSSAILYVILIYYRYIIVYYKSSIFWPINLSLSSIGVKIKFEKDNGPQVIIFEFRYIYQLMILPYSRTNKAGNKEQFWTHSSFIPTEQFAKVEQQYNTRCTYRNYISLFAGLAGLKLGSLDLVRKVIPAKVPLPGVAAIFAVVGYALGHVVFVQGFPESQVKYLLNHNTIPLWKQKKNVVNLHRAFFHLDDSNHNKPDLLYHGLTGESAAKIFPDAISGPLPKAPEFHGHGHGHGHDGHGHEEKAHH